MNLSAKKVCCLLNGHTETIQYPMNLSSLISPHRGNTWEKEEACNVDITWGEVGGFEINQRRCGVQQDAAGEVTRCGNKTTRTNMLEEVQVASLADLQTASKFNLRGSLGGHCKRNPTYLYTQTHTHAYTHVNTCTLSP